MAKTTKKQIIAYLKKKKVYEDIDELLITELLYNLTLMEDLKADILTRGTVVAINTAQTLFNVNPSLSAYQTASKALMTLCLKLGIGVKSRIELKLNEETKAEDGF